MRRSAAVPVALLLAVCAPLAWAFGPGVTPPPPTPAPPAPPPPTLALLEGAPDAVESAVVLRQGERTRVLGRVPHAEGGARRGVVLRGGEHPVVAVVAQERASVRASTYDSAVFIVDERGARRLLGSVTNSSRPLLTRAGTLLVQRGEDGEARELVDHQLRERRDALRIDAVDPSTGEARTVWRGAGQIAFLACALVGDEVAVWHLDDQRATLIALDASRGAVRTLREDLHLARDFSYDRGRAELVFAQAEDPTNWAVRALSLRDGSMRTRWRAASDRLMPAAMPDGRVAVSLPGDHGLAMLPSGATPADAPRSLAPLGEGSDAVLAVTNEWIALRHSESDRERTALHHVPTGASLMLSGGAGEVREVLGFTEAP